MTNDNDIRVSSCGRGRRGGSKRRRVLELKQRWKDERVENDTLELLWVVWEVRERAKGKRLRFPVLFPRSPASLRRPLLRLWWWLREGNEGPREERGERAESRTQIVSVALDCSAHIRLTLGSHSASPCVFAPLSILCDHRSVDVTLFSTSYSLATSSASGLQQPTTSFPSAAFRVSAVIRAAPRVRPLPSTPRCLSSSAPTDLLLPSPRDDHSGALLHVRQGGGQQVGAVHQPAVCRLQRDGRAERARPASLLLPPHAPRTRRPHREAAQLQQSTPRTLIHTHARTHTTVGCCARPSVTRPLAHLHLISTAPNLHPQTWRGGRPPEHTQAARRPSLIVVHRPCIAAALPAAGRAVRGRREARRVYRRHTALQCCRVAGEVDFG